MPKELRSQPMLQQYAQDAARTNVQRVADFIAPTVEVPTMHGRFWIHDKNTPLRIPKTLRGLGGKATEILLSEGKGQFDCTPHALDLPLDELEINEANQEGYTSIVQERADVAAWMAGLAHEKNVLDQAMNSLGAGTVVNWGANGNPIKDITSQLLAVVKNTLGGSSTGLRVLIGATTLERLIEHPEVLKRLPVGATGGKKAGVSAVGLEDLVKMLGLECEARVSLGVYDTAAEGQAAALDWTFANGVVVFAASDTPNRMDPSFMKTFRLRNYWMKLGNYQKEDGRGEVVKFDWSCDPKVCNAGAAILLKPTW
jgi:hypothetical protein